MQTKHPINILLCNKKLTQKNNKHKLINNTTKQQNIEQQTKNTNKSFFHIQISLIQTINEPN